MSTVEVNASLLGAQTTRPWVWAVHRPTWVGAEPLVLIRIQNSLSGVPLKVERQPVVVLRLQLAVRPLQVGKQQRQPVVPT